MNSIPIQDQHLRALEDDAERMGLPGASAALDVILFDFFRGWKPSDRPKFYNQVIGDRNRCSMPKL